MDPYYLTHRAEIEGFRPEIIKAARHINDGMGQWIAEQTVIEMIRAGLQVKGARVAVLGLTFKENCADLRNTKVIDCIRALESLGVEVMVHDPVADADDAMGEYGIKLHTYEDMKGSDALIVAVAHQEYRDMGVGKLATLLKKSSPLMDIKSLFGRNEITDLGFTAWRF